MQRILKIALPLTIVCMMVANDGRGQIPASEWIGSHICGSSVYAMDPAWGEDSFFAFEREIVDSSDLVIELSFEDDQNAGMVWVVADDLNDFESGLESASCVETVGDDNGESFTYWECGTLASVASVMSSTSVTKWTGCVVRDYSSCEDDGCTAFEIDGGVFHFSYNSSSVPNFDPEELRLSLNYHSDLYSLDEMGLMVYLAFHDGGIVVSNTASGGLFSASSSYCCTTSNVDGEAYAEDPYCESVTGTPTDPCALISIDCSGC